MARHSDDTKQAFLEAFAQHGRRNAAARSLDLSPQTITRWLQDDEAFADAFADAKRDLVELLEEAAMVRAVDGTDKPVFHKGDVVGYVREYSDGLLTTLLKANDPDKYKDRSATEIGNLGGQPFETNDTATAARLAALLAAAKDRKDNGDPFA